MCNIVPLFFNYSHKKKIWLVHVSRSSPTVCVLLHRVLFVNERNTDENRHLETWYCNFQGVFTCQRPGARRQEDPAWAVVRVAGWDRPWTAARARLERLPAVEAVAAVFPAWLPTWTQPRRRIGEAPTASQHLGVVPRMRRSNTVHSHRHHPQDLLSMPRTWSTIPFTEALPVSPLTRR